MRRFILAAVAALAISTPLLANIGRVKSARGAAEVQRGAEKLVVSSGLVLEKGDIISTRGQSRVGITFVDNTRIALAANSRIVITKFEYNDTFQTGTFEAEVQKGEAAIIGGLISKSGPKAMIVRTPKSAFAVRGARIVVTVK